MKIVGQMKSILQILEGKGGTTKVLWIKSLQLHSCMGLWRGSSNNPAILYQSGGTRFRHVSNMHIQYKYFQENKRIHQHSLCYPNQNTFLPIVYKHFVVSWGYSSYDKMCNLVSLHA
jgi:hypothetical protein